MSTLKVNTIQDASGANQTTTADLVQGRCKAWANFNGQGTVAIRDSFNVSSITDRGVGQYTMNYTNAMPSINYVAFMAACSDSSVSVAAYIDGTSAALSTAGLVFTTINVNPVAVTDRSCVVAGVFSD